MTTKTLELNNIERKIFWALSTALAGVLSFYLYSALVITLAGVDRSNINRQSHELATVAGALEAEYLAQVNGVTLMYAQSLGFHEVNARFTGGGADSKVALAR